MGVERDQDSGDLIWTAPLSPPRQRAPLTPKEAEAAWELAMLMGVNPNSLSKEELNELSKTWE